MAVGFDKALEVAKGYWNEVDYVTEYETAYVFSKQDDMSFGGQGPVVVLKDDGKAINFVAFLGMDVGDPINEGYIKDAD